MPPEVPFLSLHANKFTGLQCSYESPEFASKVNNSTLLDVGIYVPCMARICTIHLTSSE